MKCVAITGSASGIGAATCRRLEKAGTRIVGVDLGNADIIADLADPEEREGAISAIIDKSRGELDGVVLCAGLGPVSAPPKVIVGVNYFGAIELLDGLKDELSKKENTAAVCICSNSATTVPGIPDDVVAAMLEGKHDEALSLATDMDGSYAYAASKLALSRALRRRAPAWAEAGVRLNGIAPGAVQTPLLQAGLDDSMIGPAIREFPIPMGGFGEPEQIAASIAFLLGPDSSFCCGSILFADGGTDALVRPDSF